MKKWIKDFFSVTPKEWVAVQLFCVTYSSVVLSSYDQIVARFGPEDGTFKDVVKYSAFCVLVIAGYAQFKTRK